MKKKRSLQNKTCFCRNFLFFISSRLHQTSGPLSNCFVCLLFVLLGNYPVPHFSIWWTPQRTSYFSYSDSSRVFLFLVLLWCGGATWQEKKKSCCSLKTAVVDCCSESCFVYSMCKAVFVSIHKMKITSCFSVALALSTSRHPWKLNRTVCCHGFDYLFLLLLIFTIVLF